MKNKKQPEFFSKYYQFGTDTLKKSDDGRINVEGIISVESEDAQGETMVQKGMDFSYFMKRGYLNIEHKQGAENMIGAPTELKSVKYKGKAATFMKGYLFSESPKVKDILVSMDAMKAADCDRGLGFSIEGQVVERDKNNPSVITKSKILNVSVVASPAHPDASMELCKSLYKQMEEEEMENETEESMNEENQMDFSDISEIEEDHDGKEALSQLLMTQEHIQDLLEMIKPEDDLPEWLQTHLTIACDHIHSIYHYLESKQQMMEFQQKVSELNQITAGYMSKGKYESNVILASELHAIAQQSIEEQPVILDNEPVKIRDTRIGEFIEQELHGVLSEEEAKKIIATIIRMYPNKTITEYKQLFSQLVVEMMQRIRGDEQ
jgi:hypothetical protein